MTQDADTAAPVAAATTPSTPAPAVEEHIYPEPNPQEAMFFFNILKNGGAHDINWDAVATDSGFKNAATAKKRFSQIKQKLGLDGRGSAPATPRKGRRPSSATASPAKSPSKVTKRRKGAAAAATAPPPAVAAAAVKSEAAVKDETMSDDVDPLAV